MMKLDELKHAIDLYSADLSRWPAPMVKSALALIEASAEAKACFGSALALDDMLRAWQPDAPGLRELEQNILGRIQKVPQEGPQSFAMRWKAAWLIAPGGGLVAAAILGFMIGFSPAQQQGYLLDPVFYSQDQIIGGDDIDTYTGSMF